MSLGDRIRTARNQQQLTQPALAKRCGWDSQSRVSMYERGVRTPSTADLQRIAIATGTSFTWLATGQQPPATDGVTGEQNKGILRVAPATAVLRAQSDGGRMESVKPTQEGFLMLPSDDSEVYCVAIRGDDYAPSIRDGWFVSIEPSESPHPGEYIYIEYVDGAVDLAELLFERDDTITVSTLSSPTHQKTLHRESIVRISAISGVHPPSRFQRNR